jgi:polyisoprenoid-binding protein YceI
MSWVATKAALAVAVALPMAPMPVAPHVAPGTYKIDITHSELTFRVRHIVSKAHGTFKDWGGTITADPSALGSGTGSATIEIKTASIDTRNEKRDTHLRSPDFFDVEKYPLMTFKSTSAEVKGTAVTLKGDLTIKDVTKPIVLTGEFLGASGAEGPKQRLGFHVSGKIDRLDYGLTWNRAAEGGGLVLGDEVEMEITVAAVRE